MQSSRDGKWRRGGAGCCRGRPWPLPSGGKEGGQLRIRRSMNYLSPSPRVVCTEKDPVVAIMSSSRLYRQLLLRRQRRAGRRRAASVTRPIPTVSESRSLASAGIGAGAPWGRAATLGRAPSHHAVRILLRGGEPDEQACRRHHGAWHLPGLTGSNAGAEGKDDSDGAGRRGMAGLKGVPCSRHRSDGRSGRDW